MAPVSFIEFLEKKLFTHKPHILHDLKFKKRFSIQHFFDILISARITNKQNFFFVE